MRKRYTEVYLGKSVWGKTEEYSVLPKTYRIESWKTSCKTSHLTSAEVLEKFLLKFKNFWLTLSLI